MSTVPGAPVQRQIELVTLRQGAGERPGPWLFSMMRNERYFLPHFFAHYRRLGIANFLIYDDGSDDGTRECLMNEEHCTVVTSAARFGELHGREPNGAPLRLGVALRQSIPDQLLAGRWVLTVDADEFLVLPTGCDSLPTLIERLEKQGRLLAAGAMVDFYPATLSDRRYAAEIDPFAANPYFDTGPLFRWDRGMRMPQQLPGGIRYRLLRMLLERKPDLVRQVYGDHPVSLAKNWKVPLLRHDCGVVRHGDHEVSVAPGAGLDIALAHFKFYPALDRKIADALQLGQYYNASMEYRFLAAALDELGNVSLVAPETRRFEGPHSLSAAGLMEPSTAPA